MNQARFKKLVSGQSRGPAVEVLRFILKVLAIFYGLVITLRNWFYDKGSTKSYGITSAGLKTADRTQTTIPVISVGNITVGSNPV